MRMDARRAARQIAPAVCKPTDKADAASGTNPKGRMNAGCIAALRLACAAKLHGAHRALHCLPAFILRTPVCSVNRPYTSGAAGRSRTAQATSTAGNWLIAALY